jgi:hypothetical protein
VQIGEVQDLHKHLDNKQCTVETFASDGVQTSQTKFHKDVFQQDYWGIPIYHCFPNN